MRFQRYLRLSLGLVLLAAAPLLVGQGGAGQSSFAIDQSYLRAREVVDAGKNALGPNLDDITIQVRGKFYARQQSPRPEESEGLPLAGQLILDTKRNAILWDVDLDFPGGFQIRQVARVKGDQGTVGSRLTKTMQPLPNPAALREALTMRVPQLLVGMALQRANTLRWLGEAEFNGRKQNAVSFATATGTQIALYFDARTNLLTKYETLIADPYLGDAVNEYVLTGWRNVDGRQLPTGQTLKTGGEIAQEYTYDIRVNTKPEESVFEAPAGFTNLSPPMVALAVKPLAKDVWLVEGLGAGAYSSLVVAFKDYVLVAEPPLNEATAQTLLEKVKETVPDKPIRYVVATHHHSDHIGGVRAFMAQGITVVTTPGNVPYLEKMASRRFTLPPDALQMKPRKPVIETISSRKRVFSDGTHVVELHDIGPNPHARELVIVWLPNERILFEGDMFGRNPDNSVTPANAATVQFADAIRKMGLPVETLVGVHSRTYTPQDLQASLDLAKKNASAAGQQ